MDSLGAMDLRNAVMTHFKIITPATVAIDYSTIDALAQFVASARDTQVDARAISSQHTFSDGLIVNMQHADVLAGINEVILNVVGTTVEPQQPLREVGTLHSCCVPFGAMSYGYAYGCLYYDQ